MCLMIMLAGCGNDSGMKQSTTQAESNPSTQNAAKTVEEESEVTTMKMLIGDTEVVVNWEENESVDALKELAASGDLIISMSMYGGFEQVGSIGTSLPKNDVQITTAAGDIMLYSGSQMVVFYGSNSWAYTRLGKVTDKTAEEMEELLGNGDVTITISLD